LFFILNGLEDKKKAEEVLARYFRRGLEYLQESV
jgi:hypothetical protein